MPSKTNAEFAAPISSRFTAWLRSAKTPVIPKPRSLTVGYVLLLLLGVYGIHRLYFMHPRRSWLYYAAAWAIGLSGMGLHSQLIAGFGLILVALLLFTDLATLWMWGQAVINTERSLDGPLTPVSANENQYSPGAPKQ